MDDYSMFTTTIFRGALGKEKILYFQYYINIVNKLIKRTAHDLIKRYSSTSRAFILRIPIDFTFCK